jgi:VWFA-related protein
MIMRTRLASSSFSRMILITLLPLSLAASQSHLPNRGQKVYVVGVRDRRGLNWGGVCSPSSWNRRPLLDRVAPDDALQSAAAKEFRKEGHYVVADSAEHADFVFIIEGDYQPLFVARHEHPGTSGDIYFTSSLDQKPDHLFGVGAIAVPASIYREAPADWPTLFRARLWGARESDVTVDSSANSGGGKVRIDAQADHLVRMFSGKEDTPLRLSSNLCVYPSREQADQHVESAAKSSGAETSAASQPVGKVLAGDPFIRLAVDFVSVPVAASDVDGKYIPGLKISDFHIFEDDVEQQIDRLVPESEPLNAALMIDSSCSMPVKFDQVQRSALLFVESMRPEDRLMVASFDDRVYLDSEFTSDRLALRRAILATRLGGTTRLYDALDLVLTERLDPVSGRKAIVLFTDGVDTSSWLADSAGTLAELEESNVILYAFQFETQLENVETEHLQHGWAPVIVPPGMAKNEEMRAYGSQYLQDLASRSGGRFFHAATMGSAVEAAAQVADELRHQYVLGYYPSNRARDGSYRRIRVTVDRLGVKIRARSGYRVSTRHATDSTHGIGK